MAADFLIVAAVTFLSELGGPAWPGAPQWLSTRVLACGIAAMGLLLFSLVLKGVQKVITVLIAAVVVLGGVWLVQDAWTARSEILPPELAAELDAMAQRALAEPEAVAAWKSVQAGWARWKEQGRAQLAAGGDQARKAIAEHVEAKAKELQRAGKRAAAEELRQFGRELSPSE